MNELERAQKCIVSSFASTKIWILQFNKKTGTRQKVLQQHVGMFLCIPLFLHLKMIHHAFTWLSLMQTSRSRLGSLIASTSLPDTEGNRTDTHKGFPFGGCCTSHCKQKPSPLSASSFFSLCFNLNCLSQLLMLLHRCVLAISDVLELKLPLMNNKHSGSRGSAFGGNPGPSLDLRGRGTGMTQL